MAINTKKNNISFVNFFDSNYKRLWQAFLESYPQYSFHYQLPGIEYYKLLSKNVVDESFVLKNSDIPLAICVLVFENCNGRFQASMSNELYLPTPLFHPGLSNKQIRVLEELVFGEIKSRLAKYKVNRLFVQSDVMSVGFDKIEDQMFARFGALDVSSYHHIIDLGLSDEAIWEQFRHSSKSIINRGRKTYEFKVYDHSNYTDEIGTRHRLLHHKTAGRVTRPIATFEKMYSWIDNGCGLMFEQLLNGQVVQMIFVALGKNTAVGASAADDPDVEITVPLTHSMNYFIFQETKRRGIRYYDAGETAFRSTPYKMYSPKEMKIHYFKRGFSDRSFPLKRWIWFPNPDEELIYLEEKLAKYKQFVRNDVSKKDKEKIQ